MSTHRSPADVGVEVVAGLIAIAGQRERAIEALRVTVEAAVHELDPHGRRDSSATWWEDHPWARPDGFDRLRRAFDDLMLLEAQSKEIVDGLRSALTGARRVGVPTPVEAHRRLQRIAERRAENLRALGRAERSVNRGLTSATAARLRRSIREMSAEEERGRQYRDRLGRLLAMGDLVARAG